MAPTIVIAGVFLVLPIIYAVILAFYKVQLLGEVSYQFAGAKNFIRIANDDRVWTALKIRPSMWRSSCPFKRFLPLPSLWSSTLRLKVAPGFGLLYFYQPLPLRRF